MSDDRVMFRVIDDGIPVDIDWDALAALEDDSAFWIEETPDDGN